MPMDNEIDNEIDAQDITDFDFAVGDGSRSTRIINDGGITQMAQTFYVKDAVETVKKMAAEAQRQGIRKGAETRCAAILHEGQLQEIANKHGITLKQLMFDANYEDLLWAEGTGRDYSQMQIHKA